MPRERKPTYSELLKDPRWQRLRLEVFERDGWACQKCGDKHKTLNVHHMVYRRGAKPWEYPIKLLLTLCEDCHGEESYADKQKAVTKLVEALAERGAHAPTIDELAEWVLQTAVPDIAGETHDFSEVVAALRFLSSEGDSFLASLIHAYYTFGPWCEKLRPFVGYTSENTLWMPPSNE